VTFRAVVIALILSVLSILWIHQASLTQAPGNVYAPVYLLSVPPVGAVFCLIFLVALVPLSGRVFKRKLSNWELITIYMFLVLAIPVTTMGIVGLLLPTMANPVYFHTPQDNLMELAEAMPQWAYPHDEEVIRQMYEGSADGAVPWGAWAYPLAMWTGFMALVFFTGMCLLSLFRKQWVEHERLRFPLLFIPLSIVAKEAPGSTTSFFRNPLVWIAFALVAIHHTLNVLHSYNPNVMGLMHYSHVGQIFTERPWSAYRYIYFHHRPQMVGLAYFVSLDVLFSGWFFHLLQPMLALLSDVFGLHADPRFPFVQQQGVGAYLAMIVVLFWVARRQISLVVRKAFHNTSEIDDSDEHMPHRWALFGTIVGFVAIIIWAATVGFSPAYSIPFFAMIIGFGLVYARVRAEAAVPSVWAYPFNQHYRVIRDLIGDRALIRGNDISNLAMMASFSWFSRGIFSSQMAYQMENEALAGEMHKTSRALPVLMMAAFLVGCVVAYYLNLKDYYGFGALVLHGGTAKGGYNIRTSLGVLNGFAAAITNPGLPNPSRMAAVGAGALVTTALVILRQFWLRSPFHPLGYIAILNHGYALWAPFFTAWVLKSIIHRLGGARLFRQLMPFFLGLAMADLLIAGISRVLMALFGPDILAGYIVYFG